jgi:hypothetical protein
MDAKEVGNALDVLEVGNWRRSCVPHMIGSVGAVQSHDLSNSAAHLRL